MIIRPYIFVIEKKGTVFRPSLYIIIMYRTKLFHNNLGGVNLTVLVDLEHVNATVEVGNIHLGGAGDGFAINLLTNDVEELDVSLLVVTEVHGEVVGGGVRIDSGVGLLQFRNVHNLAVIARYLCKKIGIMEILVPRATGTEIVAEEILAGVVDIIIGDDSPMVDIVVNILSRNNKIAFGVKKTVIGTGIFEKPSVENGVVSNVTVQRNGITTFQGVSNVDDLIRNAVQIDG